MASGMIEKPENRMIYSPSVNDLNNAIEPQKITFVRSFGNTLNTPYKAGLTGNKTGGVTMSYSDNEKQYGVQLSFATGSTDIYIRGLSGGTWSSWRKI